MSLLTIIFNEKWALKEEKNPERQIESIINIENVCYPYCISWILLINLIIDHGPKKKITNLTETDVQFWIKTAELKP